MKSLRMTLSLMLACVVSACTGTKSPTAPAATTPPVATTLTTPAADSPGDGAQLDNVRPTLTVVNSTSSQSGARTYEFQIADNSEFAANANTVRITTTVVDSTCLRLGHVTRRILSFSSLT